MGTSVGISLRKRELSQTQNSRRLVEKKALQDLAVNGSLIIKDKNRRSLLICYWRRVLRYSFNISLA